MSVQNSNIPSYLHREVHRVAAPGVNALARGERQCVHGAARDLQQHEAAGNAPRHRRLRLNLDVAAADDDPDAAVASQPAPLAVFYCEGCGV